MSDLSGWFNYKVILMKNNFHSFIATVTNNQCKEGMYVALNADISCGLICFGPIIRFRKDDLKQISSAIESGNCKSHLSIDLKGNQSGDDISYLLNCLKSPLRPANLKFYLAGNKISNQGLKDIAAILIDAARVEGLVLKLNGRGIGRNVVGDKFDSNQFDDNGFIDFAEGLKKVIAKNNCPGLVIDFGGTLMSDRGALVIANALEEVLKNNPPTQKITLKCPSHISLYIHHRISSALDRLAGKSYEYEVDSLNRPNF